MWLLCCHVFGALFSVGAAEASCPLVAELLIRLSHAGNVLMMDCAWLVLLGRPICSTDAAQADLMNLYPLRSQNTHQHI